MKSFKVKNGKVIINGQVFSKLKAKESSKDFKSTLSYQGITYVAR